MAASNPAFDTILPAEGPAESTQGPVAPVPVSAPLSAAVQRFQSCRWRRPADQAAPEGCAHRDVLPLTGTNGFDPAAWCPDCAFYKLRRTPKKRDYLADRY
ncbi:MAG: hypothetical protein H6Q10_3538 [Acidobacteria bacterium]|nr:hypothetical protein [Acidobacteriota bacterium]